MAESGKLKGKEDQIFAWLKEGKRQDWIAEQCSVSPQAISYWVKVNTKVRRIRKKKR